jgi:uncharacterized protein (TIGR01777 family)
VVTGATGLIGSRLVTALTDRGDEVTVFSRDPDRAASRLGVKTVAWDPEAGPAPADALAAADGVVHLAGESVAQRWTAAAKQRIRSSREVGTENLVSGLRAAEPRPAVLVSSSAAGYYGDAGSKVLDESAPPSSDDSDFLAAVCVAWERAASEAVELGIRVALLRTGVVLDRSGGALAKMLTPFKAGIGGPIAGGRQYVPWIHVDDVVGMYLAALDGGSEWTGAFNVCAPEAVTNAEFARALGRALHRPALIPVPALTLRLLYGEMAAVVTGGQRMVPARALSSGYRFRHPELEPALAAALD